MPRTIRNTASLPASPVRAARFLCLALALAFPIGARADEPAPRDLTGVGLEGLMNLEVTSVSRHGQRLSQTASAITVLDAETIRRSGASCVPEVLRLVPGVDVQRITANMWAVSARGSARRLANKMLVMVDGRCVYNPMFSGTYWDAQDLPLDAVDRIEVIRGPGSTAWGANAVNGVINVITRHARETHGLFATATAGDRDRATGELRWGGAPRNGLDVRAWVRATDRASFDRSPGVRANDSWNGVHGGFRSDWAVGPGRSLLLETELRETRAGGTTMFVNRDPLGAGIDDFRTTIRNGHALARWTERLGSASDLTVQAYFDREARSDRLYGEDVRTSDAEARWHLVHGRHELVTGIGARSIHDRSHNTVDVEMRPERDDQWLWNGFAQDEVSLLPSRLRLTLGTKLERHEATGVEFQPNVRALWTPDANNSAWAAWSRALRTPSRVELSIRRAWVIVPGDPPSLFVVEGSPEARSERLDAWEVGYRLVPRAGVSLDAAAFRMEYHRLISFTQGTPTFIPASTPYVEIPMIAANDIEGDIHGLEVSVACRPSNRARFHGGLTWAAMRLHANVPQLGDPTGLVVGSVPRLRGFASASIDLPRRFETDVIVYAVDRLPAQQVPAYGRLDARLGWRPDPRWEFAVTGQNLTDARHLESNLPEDVVTSTEVPRSFDVRITSRFR